MRSTATTVTFRAARVASWTWVLVVILSVVLPVGAAACAGRAAGVASTVHPAAAPSDQSHAVGEARTCEYVLTLREASDTAPSATDVRLVIGNRDPGCKNRPHAVVLRGVQWLDGTASPQRWFGPLPGMTVALEHGSIEHTSASVIAHTLDAVPMTEHQFEKGLLLPNEEIAVTVPRPAAGAEPVVVVRFQVLQGPEVFIPGPSVQGLTIYALATPDAYHAYLAGGEAKPVLVRETMQSAGSPAELREARIPVWLAAVPLAGRERSSTSAATDSFTTAMVAGHPWRYEVSVERAEDSVP